MNCKPFGDYYDVYDNGDIFSHKTKKILKRPINSYGYVKMCLRVNNKQFNLSLHRILAILFLPNIKNLPEVDHKDRDPLNNSIFNLHWVTHSQNLHNRGLRCDNTSGYTGVCYDARLLHWIGRITINGIRKQKLFLTKEEAICYRLELESEYEFSLIRDANISSIIYRI
jgi:hypothetical protein